MKVKIQQVLPRGFYKVEPHSWECELYKEDENGQILVAVDYYCRENNQNLELKLKMAYKE